MNSRFLFRRWSVSVEELQYELIVAPRFLKQIFARRAKLRVLRTSIFQGATIRDINTLLSLLFTTKFSSMCKFKNHIELFSTFLGDSVSLRMSTIASRDSLNQQESEKNWVVNYKG